MWTENGCIYFAAADVHMFEGESRLKEVLRLVAADPRAVTPDAVLLGGDLVGKAVPLKKPRDAGGHVPLRRPPPPLPEHERNPVFCLEEIRRDIASAFPAAAIYLTYGSHDKNEVHGGAGFFRTGKPRRILPVRYQFLSDALRH